MTGADMDRATSELKDYADKLIFIRGINFKFSRNHDGGPVAAGTGAPITGSGTKQLPVSESADFFIARTLSPGQEPLTLYAGRKNTFRDDAFSFSTGGKLRVGDNNPWNVYQRLSGLRRHGPDRPRPAGKDRRPPPVDQRRRAHRHARPAEPHRPQQGRP